MKTKPKLNVRLIRKVIKHITEEPKRYFQHDFIRTGEPGGSVAEDYFNDTHKYAQCGTAGCIAGWAYLLSAARPNKNAAVCTIVNKATKKMGITSDQSDMLFTGIPSEDWPAPFGKSFLKAKTLQGKANVAARLLEKVIDTKGSILKSRYED